MNKIDFERAYYVKLGRSGKWESNSVSESKLRIGWKEVKREDFVQKNWAGIEKAIRDDFDDQGAATRDFNALKNLMNSDSNDVWITFHNSMLWWCKLKGTGILHDDVSNYLEVEGNWNNNDTKGRILFMNQLPGSLSKIQGFRATVCRVGEQSTLKRVINAEASPQYKEVVDSKNVLVANLAHIIKELHPKDFELLIDLIFTASGWRRVSPLGKNMKFSDIELQDPINGYRYQVQVKSTATLKEFKKYEEGFDQAFDKLFFVVHTPDKSLIDYQPTSNEIQLIFLEQLSNMVVENGLIDWVLDRAK